MDKKQFNFYSRIVAFAVFLIASITYLATIEPTTSFWDCGEFIASSYKLEVGHAPGNPVFQLIARFFTLFVSKEYAAMAVNAMSALCSALTILFLFLTIAHLARKILVKNNTGTISFSDTIAILGSAVVGSLAYCWSDTFWFSAVEGEVYAMSSLFTAAVFWAILKWEDDADNEYADRWIVLIALLMGLSIGVHLLNLLAIPAIAFVCYYKKSSKFTFGRFIGVFLLSCVILATILWGIIPGLPKLAAYFDLLFVNVFKLPFNSGAAVFMLILLALCFLAIYISRSKKQEILHLVFLCFTMIIIGYSIFAVVVIRSANNTPTNENQPDNPFSLVRYLGREQYGSYPLVYGENFASVPNSYDEHTYYTPLDGKYYKAQGPITYKFPQEAQSFFPRMWSPGTGDEFVPFYQNYMKSSSGKKLKGGKYRMPTFGENLAYFFDYQINWMYIRYFMWNFAGRQNDIHSPAPGDPLKGNWETGIGFYDRARLGDQSVGPEGIIHNKAKNHYYMLPLLLGLIGLFFQLRKDKQSWWVTMLLFLLTGVAIIVYLNQTPYQVRERDYAYAGSFYMFTIWIGLSVLCVYQWLAKPLSKIKVPQWATATIVSIVLLLVPVLMVSQNWDDHDRSNRYTARDLAYNYFMSADSNAVIVSHGDNDTFPLWYIQEVEEVRLDARIMNTSLLGTDWYIDQMQKKQYDADPIKFSTKRASYLYGTNEFIPIVDRVNRPITAKEAISLFNNPRVKYKRYGESVDYIASHHITIPVNKENVKKYGIVSEKDYDKIVDTVYLNIPDNKEHLSKSELMILDMFSNYDWDRPIYFVSQGGDLKLGLKSYLQFDGFLSKFVPIKSTTTITEYGHIDTDKMYNKIMDVYRWGSFQKKYYSDYQNISTFDGSTLNIRSIFIQTALGLALEGEKEKAVKVLDKMQEYIPTENLPYNSSIWFSSQSINEYMLLQAIEIYLKCGAKEKAIALSEAFLNETLLSIQLAATPFGNSYISKADLENNYSMYFYTINILKTGGAPEEAGRFEETLNKAIEQLR